MKWIKSFLKFYLPNKSGKNADQVLIVPLSRWETLGSKMLHKLSQSYIVSKHWRLAPWKKNYDKPRQCNKSLYSQSYGFSSSHVLMGELDPKEALKNWCFHIVVLENTSWVSLGLQGDQPSLKEINPDYSLEGLMLKQKLQFFGHLMPRADPLKKTLMLGKIEGRRIMGQQRVRGLEWHNWLTGHEFEQTPGDTEGQGSLACCSPWGHKQTDWVTE